MDREKALEYFKRTGKIYIIVYSHNDTDIYSEDVKPLNQLSIDVYQFDDFLKAEKYYEKVRGALDRGTFTVNGAVKYANLTTAKRCLYPYGDTLTD